MTLRADAHIHLFEGGFQGDSFTHRPGVAIDEAACYASLAAEHDIQAALVVGYAGESWCAHNNDYLDRMVQSHAWIKPIAYVSPAQPPSIDTLSTWRDRGFVGISMYLLDDDSAAALASVDDACWEWLVQEQALVSVNAPIDRCRAWLPVLERHPSLRLLVSHLGLPARVATAPDASQAAQALAPLLALSQFPGPRVKLSGFYALTEPGHAYPHEAAWPYVAALLDAFGAERLLWGSDFSPHLDHVSFPQAVNVLANVPFISAQARERIEGGNLLDLLEQVGGR